MSEAKMLGLLAFALVAFLIALGVGEFSEKRAFHCGRAFQKAYLAYGNLDGCGRYVEWMER